MRVLIVDDSSVMRKIVARSLQQAGLNIAQVLEAANGTDALVVVRQEKVDLILCDINMPVIDGPEFVKQLSGVENARGVPVVMITTEGSESHVVQALSAGARGYIRKPFTPEQVKEGSPGASKKSMNAIYPELDDGGNRQPWTAVLERATREVFALMLGSRLTPALHPNAENGLDIAAIVGLAGCVSGAISLRCTQASAALMAGKMVGVNSGEAGPEVQDAVGEVCNMIAGNFKNKITGMADGCPLSVPTVIAGTDYNLHSLPCSTRVEIHLLFENLPLIISIMVHS